MFARFRKTKPARTTTRQRPASSKPCLEVLEDRTVPAAVFDPAGDFSTTNNPNQVWSYGYSQSLGSAFHLLTASSVTSDGILHTWHRPDPPYHPQVYFNPASSTVTSGTVVLGGQQIAQHPGPSGEYSIIRFTAPVAGAVQIDAGFFGVDNCGTTTDVHILHNRISLFDGNVNGFGDASPTFVRTLSVLPNDTIDFAVGFGSNQNYSCDTTGLRATIAISLPDINMLSAQLQNANTVRFTYETTGNPGPFQVGLYRSADGVSYDPVAPLDIQTFTPTTPNFNGSGTLTIPDPLRYDTSQPYLVVVADPLHALNTNGDPTNDVASLLTHPLAWGAKVSNEFNQKVVAIAQRLGTDPNWLMAAMAVETDGTFSPGARGSRVGLLSWDHSSAGDVGTTLQALRAMTAVEQLDYVERYFAQYRGRLNSAGDVYMAVLWPAGIGRADDYVVFDSRHSDPRQRRYYHQNSPSYFDRDHSGQTTKGEIVSRFLETLERGLGGTLVGCYFT